MKQLELAAAGVMLALAAVVLLSTTDLHYWTGVGPGNRFVPIWISVVTIVLSLVLIRDALRRTGDQPADWPDLPGALRVGGTYAAICVLPYVVEFLGFLLAIAVFMMVVLLAFLRCPLKPSLLTVLITTGTIYSVFIASLSIPLPKGIFGF